MTVNQAIQDAISHHHSGRLTEAEVIYCHILAQFPDNIRALHGLGVIYSQSGKLNAAVNLFTKAISLNPSFADAQNHLGIVLLRQGKSQHAIAAFSRLVQLQPNSPLAHGNLGTAYLHHKQLHDALAAFSTARRLDPNFDDVLLNMGIALKDQGKLNQALHAFRGAAAAEPSNADILGNVCFHLLYDPAQDEHSLRNEAVLWNQKHAEPLRHLQRPHINDRSPDRKLKIGYVSPDFRRHGVGRMIMPLLANHNHQQFEICCYSNPPWQDEMTIAARSHADHWLNTRALSDEQLSARIREDGIDILVDLAAHTAGNRLLVFARKPAPIQVTWFTGTTGMNAIDYRLTDRFFDPPGTTAQFNTEKLIHLRSFWCYQPPGTPAVNSLPADSAGCITFGCLNSFAKVNSATLQLWIQILQQVKGSQLLLKADPGSHQDRLRGLFQDAGVSPDRLAFVGNLPDQKYYELYHRIDIGLDPFPFNGHTTTFDFLWMGVPVITLAGRTCVGRAGASILSNLGMTELIARTPEEYISIAVAKAGDLTMLSQLRAALRRRMQDSPLMNAIGYARNFEKAYRNIWHAWCNSTL